MRIEDDLLVGFKWIGQRIDEAGPAGFLFGFEESHGYLKGTTSATRTPPSLPCSSPNSPRR